jgi:hypothetical protein
MFGAVHISVAQIVGRVPGVLKLTSKEKDKEKAMYGEKGKGSEVTSTLAFEPPTLVRWSRFDVSGRTSFITAFYCSPAGTSPARKPGTCVFTHSLISH